MLERLATAEPSFSATISTIRWLGLDGRDAPDCAAAAMAQISATFAVANAGDTAALLEVARTDPVSVLHALGTLPEPDGRRLAGAYFDILDRCAANGVDLLTTDARPVVGLFRARLLGGMDEPPVAPLERFSSTTFALQALAATRLGTLRLDLQAPMTRALSRASMLVAARRRDYANLGLFLLGHALCFHGDDVSHVTSWLSRTRRSDGLYGVWDLFHDGCSAANLAASVNVAWGLSAQQASPPPLEGGDHDQLARSAAHMFGVAERPALRDAADLDRGIQGLQAWIERHLDQFMERRFADQQQYGEAVKRLVEVVLALWLVSRRPGPDATWARGLAERIRASVDGEGLVEAIRVFPTTILAALMFPMLADICGRPGPFDEEVRTLVQDPYSEGQERIPMRQMDYHFLRSLIEDPEASFGRIDELLERTLLAARPNPCLLGNDALYDITHAIFYATGFGQRALAADAETLAWCAQWMPELCLSFLLEGDLDIGGELLMNWMQLQLPRDQRFDACVRLLIAGLREDGAAPGPTRSDTSGSTDFELTYHTTLIALITLIEVRNLHVRA